MATQDQQFQIALADVAQSQLRARYYEQRIQTGVWKERIGKVRQGSHDGPLLPEEDLLRAEVATLNQHIQLAEDHLDHAKSIAYRCGKS